MAETLRWWAIRESHRCRFVVLLVRRCSRGMCDIFWNREWRIGGWLYNLITWSTTLWRSSWFASRRDVPWIKLFLECQTDWVHDRMYDTSFSAQCWWGFRSLSSWCANITSSAQYVEVNPRKKLSHPTMFWCFMASIRRFFVYCGTEDVMMYFWLKGRSRTSDNLYSNVDMIYKGVLIFTNDERKVWRAALWLSTAKGLGHERICSHV